MTTETKVYSIGLKGSSSNYGLVHLQSDQFHGVHCLKGIARSPKSGANIEGKRIYIPIVEITTITEYDTWNDFVAASKLTNGSAKKSATPPAAMKKMKAKKTTKSKKRR